MTNGDRSTSEAVQPDDTKPHYTESSGDYLYKMPDDGVPRRQVLWLWLVIEIRDPFLHTFP